jgi:nucleoside-diphosphate-sugar epimerase
VVANVYNLLRVIDRGWPLPLGLVKNRRSFVYVCNLVDAMVKAMEHPDAAGETFLVSDGEDLSTPEFIRAIARALDKPARLLPVPLTLLWLAGRMLGKAAEVDRLLGSLVVDNAKIRGVLGWQPRCTMAEGLAHTVQWYLKCQAALTH